MKFPYRSYRVSPTPTLPDGILSRPEIPLRVTGPGGTISVLALVDTGADETILPRSVGNRVGAIIDDSVRWPLGGIAGQEIHASPGAVDLKLAGPERSYSWTATVAFVTSPGPADEQAILGHAGFLAWFRALFDGESRELEILPVATFPGTIV